MVGVKEGELIGEEDCTLNDGPSVGPDEGGSMGVEDGSENVGSAVAVVDGPVLGVNEGSSVGLLVGKEGELIGVEDGSAIVGSTVADGGPIVGIEDEVGSLGAKDGSMMDVKVCLVVVANDDPIVGEDEGKLLGVEDGALMDSEGEKLDILVDEEEGLVVGTKIVGMTEGAEESGFISVCSWFTRFLLPLIITICVPMTPMTPPHISSNNDEITVHLELYS